MEVSFKRYSPGEEFVFPEMTNDSELKAEEARKNNAPSMLGWVYRD